jgi:hypothetical protein
MAVLIDVQLRSHLDTIVNTRYNLPLTSLKKIIACRNRETMSICFTFPLSLFSLPFALAVRYLQARYHSIPPSVSTIVLSMRNDIHREEDPLAPLLPEIAQIASDVQAWALGNLRRYDPAFKVPYSTSALTGPERVEEHLNAENPSKMRDLYGMSRSAFVRLRDELELVDGKSVTADEQLANFLLLVRKGASLRANQDSTQRAKSTESDYFQLVLSRLADAQGFYGRYVKMPSASSRPHPLLLEKNEWKEFSGCVGAIDGTRLPIQCVVHSLTKRPGIGGLIMIDDLQLQGDRRGQNS